MPTQVQFRRGTTAQNNSFTGAAGEISVNSSNNTIRVHDGATAGGFELAKRGNVSTLTSGTSAELAAVISDETGSGALVFATSPTLVTPILGTPQSVTLTNGTGLPISSGVSGLGTGIATFLATPSSANFAAALTDESGSSAVAFTNSPVLLTPNIGTPSYAVLTNATGLPIVAGTTGTLSVARGGTGVTASTGSGNVVLSTSPVLTTPALGTPSAIVLTNATGTASNLTANIANFISVSDDTSTNATRYPIFANGTSGAIVEQVSSTKLFFNPSTGLLTSTDYNSSSDKRLKKNIKTVSNAIETINALRGVTFEWKEGGIKSAGLIAQEVEKVLPDSVSVDDNGFMGIRYNNLIGILVEAVKDQQIQINSLKQQIEKLNG